MSKSNKIFDILRVVAEDIEPVAAARVAAAVVYKNKIVSIGYCRYHSHPFQKKFGSNNKAIYLHAEIDAILKAKAKRVDLSKCSMYVARVKRSYSNSNAFIFGLAKPCEGCQKAIKFEGLKDVYYST